MTKKIWSYLRHSDSKLRFSWYCLQLGLLIFAFFPALGAVGLFLGSLITCVQEYRQIIKHPLFKGFIFLSLLLIVTVSFAGDKITAFLGLFNLLPFFLLFTGWSYLIQSMWQLKRISWMVIIGSLPVIILGMGQLFLGWSAPSNVFGWTLIDGGNPPERMASVFMYANTLAGYLVIVFILNLGLCLQEWQRFRKGWGEKVKSLQFFFLTLMAIANFAGLILTNSRNAWVIVLLACLAYAIYQGWRLVVAVFTGIAGSIVLAAFAPLSIAKLFRQVVPAFFWARFNDQLHPDRPVALMRTTQWNFAWSLTMQRPWTGWGLRSFSDVYQAKMNLWLGHPHNLFFMLSAETGLPATLLFCGLLGWIFVQGLRSHKILRIEDQLIFFSYLLVFAAWILFNTVDVSIFDFRLNTLFWLMLSAVCGVVLQRDKELAQRGANKATIPND